MTDEKTSWQARSLDEKFGSALTSVEAELKQAIAFINDRVVPEVRKDSTEALRKASQWLERMAADIETRKGKR